MHCSLMVSCVQVPNPQMENGGGMGVGVETGQASAPLWASVFLSLKEEDGARDQAAPPPPHLHLDPLVYGLGALVFRKNK